MSLARRIWKRQGHPPGFPTETLTPGKIVTACVLCFRRARINRDGYCTKCRRRSS